MIKGDLIYDSFQTGSDSLGLSVAILVAMVAAGLISLSLAARRARKNGKSIKIPFWNFVADHAISATIVVSVLSLALIVPFSVHSLRDWQRLEQGNYLVWTGSVDRNTAQQITRDRLAVQRGTFHERDQVVVAGRAFYIMCDRPYEGYPTDPGDIGGCLPVKLGEIVQVDAIQLSPTQYRAEPLRIWRGVQKR